jgi:hypothetical protein
VLPKLFLIGHFVILATLLEHLSFASNAKSRLR